MIYVRRFGIRLRIADAAFRAVITPNAALTALREVCVIGQENGELVWRNGEFCDQVRNLGIEPIDVHQGRGETEYRARLSVRPRRAQRLLRQDRGAQKQMRTGMGLDRAPEIRALVRIDVLRSAYVDAALGVGRTRLKERGIECVRRYGVAVREHMGRIISALRAILV